METFSALLALCAGNSSVTSEFPSQRPVTRNFDAFFELRLNKRLSKQSRRWWFETLSHSLCRHRNDVWATDARQSHDGPKCEEMKNDSDIQGRVAPTSKKYDHVSRDLTYIWAKYKLSNRKINEWSLSTPPSRTSRGHWRSFSFYLKQTR